MSALAPTVSEAPTDFAAFTKIQKLAALLVMLGPEAAAPVLRGLNPHDIEAVTGEMSRLESVPQGLQSRVLEEFSSVAVEAGTSLRGGANFARTALEKALGQFAASDVMNRVSPKPAALPLVHSLAEMEPRQLFNLVAHEQPQTIALVLSYLDAEKAAQVAAFLPAELRDQAIERLATLGPTPIEVVEKVVEVLKAKAGTRQTRALNQTGGVKTAAELLNAMDKSQTKVLLQNLEKQNPELTRAIKQKMFTFEDLATIETSVLQAALRDVDARELAMALKPASEKLKTLLLGCLSKRAAEGVREEIAFMAAAKPRDIESAQMRIVDAVRKLENEGEAESEAAQEAQHVAA